MMATRLPKTALQMLNLGQVTKGVFVVVVLCESDTAIKQHVTKCKSYVGLNRFMLRYILSQVWNKLNPIRSALMLRHTPPHTETTHTHTSARRYGLGWGTRRDREVALVERVDWNFHSSFDHGSPRHINYSNYGDRLGQYQRGSNSPVSIVIASPQSLARRAVPGLHVRILHTRAWKITQWRLLS